MNMAAWHGHIMTSHYETKCVYKLSQEGKWDLITLLRIHNTFRELPGVPSEKRFTQEMKAFVWRILIWEDI